MATAPDFTGCTAIYYINMANCAMATTLTACLGQIYSVKPTGDTLFVQGGTNETFDSSALPTQVTDLIPGWPTFIYNFY